MTQIPDTAPGPYYVSVVRESGDYRLLAGPYDSHQAALDNVEKARAIAEKVDRRAVWYAYGTCRITDGSYSGPGLLNVRGLM